MKTSTQLKAKIRNISKQKRIKAEVVLRNYMLERFLERISLSEYKNNFILKGGFLIASMVGIDTRSTMDMDATVKGQAVNNTELEKIINDVLSIEIDDGVEMKLLEVNDIHDEAEYPGLRVSIACILDKTKQTIKIDVTTGDVITPREIKYSFPLMLEDRNIQIQAYNLETVLAEKLETIIDRNTTNTRMRDFYDVHILTTMLVTDINYDVFAQAFVRTAKKRDSLERIRVDGADFLDMIEKSDILMSSWRTYQKKNLYSADITFAETVADAKRLFDKTGLI